MAGEGSKCNTIWRHENWRKKAKAQRLIMTKCSASGLPPAPRSRLRLSCTLLWTPVDSGILACNAPRLTPPPFFLPLAPPPPPLLHALCPFPTSSPPPLSFLLVATIATHFIAPTLSTSHCSQLVGWQVFSYVLLFSEIAHTLDVSDTTYLSLLISYTRKC